MKKGWQWFKYTVRYFGLALSVSGLVYAQQQPAGVVTGLQGQAQLTRAAAQTPLRFKDGVVIRDVIDTREKSLARILFGGRSTVTVREMTRLVVREETLPTGARRDVYDLSSGAILVNVARQLMRPGDEVIIRTPNAVGAVRGSTIFCQCILVPVIQCNLALLFGSAIVTPDGQPPVTLTPNTSLNVTGTGPGVQATQTTITQAQANQILAESQVGKVVKEEANQGQIAQSQTQIATELATAVIEATTQTGATTLETTASETKAAETGETTTTGTESTKADITPDTSKTTQGDQQVVVSSPKTLQGTETLKTFDQSGSWTGSYPIVEVTGTTVDRASEGNIIQVNSGVEFTLDGTLLQITDSTITDSGVLAVSGILKNTSTETLIVIDPTTIDTPGDFITIGPGGSLTTEGQLVTDVGGTFNVGGDYLKIFDGGKLTSNTLSSVFDFDSSEVNVGSDGGDTHFTRVTGASSEATTKGPLVKAKDTDFNIKGSAFLEVSSGGKVKSTTTSPFADLSGGSLTLGTNVRALFLGSSATLDTGGSLFKAAGTTLTAAGGVPFMQIDGSTLKVGGSILDLANLSADLKGGLFKATDATLTPGSGVPFIKLDPSSLTVGGPFLDLTNVNLDLGNQPVARLEGGSTLKNTVGPLFKISGGSLKADALGTTDGAGNTFNLTGTLLDLANTTVTLRTLGEDPDSSTDTTTFTLAADEPWIKMANSTLKTTRTDDNLIELDPDETGSTFKGVALVATDSTLTLGSRLMDMKGVFSSTSTSPLIQLTNSTVNNIGDLIAVEPGSVTDITLVGQLLKASGSTIKVKNKDVNTVTKTQSVGAKPFDVAFAGQRAYVVNFTAGTVSIINTRTNTLESTLNVGSFPSSIFREGSNIYVVNAGSNTVSRIDAITNTVTNTISVGSEPRDVTILPNNDKAYVTNFAGDTVSVIRTSDNTVIKTISVGDGPEGIDFSPDGKKVGVLNQNAGTVSIIDTSTDTVTATITVGTKPVDGAFTLKNDKAYIVNKDSDNVSVINVATNSFIKNIAVGDGPDSIAITPDSKKAYVGNEFSDTVSVIDIATDTVVKTISVGDEPDSIAISPDGKRAYVTNFASNTVKVIDTESDTVIATVNVGTGPGTIALTRGGTIAFVLNEDSNNISIVDTIDLGNFLAITGGAILKSTSTLPLLQLNPSTLEIGGNLVSITGSGSKLELAGALVSGEDTKFDVRRILRVRDGGVLTSSTTGALMQFTGTAADKSKVTTLFELASIDQLDTTDKPPEVSLAGPFLKATNTTFSAGENSIDKSVFITVADGGLLKSTGTDPLIIFDGSTVDPSFKFLQIASPDSAGTRAKLEVAGPLLSATNSSSFTTSQDFITVQDKAILKGTGTTALVQSTDSTFSIGNDVEGFGNFLRLDNSTATSSNGPATVELAGPLISDSGSTFDIFSNFLRVRNGSTFTSTTIDPLIQFSGSTVETGDDFFRLEGTDSKVTLSGSFLSAGSTLNIGTNPARSGDLVDIRDGGQLVMNSSNPVVLFTGGTHTVGTDDSTSNNTPNRLFRLAGRSDTSHLDSNGLGTDQPMKGNGTDPAPFTGASNPIGGLLKATDGATIEVKKGAEDTSGANNALRLDTVLFETAGRIIELIGSATNETTLTTADSTLSFFKSKVVSLGPVVAMDKSFINVTNGPFIILTGGTEWKVDGDFLKLFNGSKIEVINGPLILVQGTSSTEKESFLKVTGALAQFGGSGNNKIIVNNSLCSGACVTKGGSGVQAIQVKEGSPGSITIGSNPIKNSNLGSIQYQGNNTALIQTGSSGKVEIDAPGASGENLVQNGGFETTGSIPEWNLTGAGSIITNFGTPPSAGFSPPQQQHMAIIHTGTGSANNTTSSISQQIGTLSPESVYLITFNYNFMSNEFPTQSTSFNDTFEAKLFHGETTTSLATESRNSSTFKTDKPTMSGGGFTLNAGNGYTDFKEASKTVVLDADTATLEFKVFDVGDASVDSGVLIDDVVMQLDPPLYLLTNGQTLVGPSLKPLVEYSDETVTFDSVLVSSGPPPNGTSSVSLSGPLLKAERSNMDVPFSLLGLLDGSTLTTTSSDPLVWLQDGNYSLSHLNGTAIFDFWGTKTALDPETGVEVGTGKTVQHGGPLLEASGGATVNTQKVLKLDTALLEATAPIISLLGTPTAQTGLTTQQSTIDLIKAKVTSTGPVVAMDKSFINVTNGALINLTHGSNMKVTGDLISMLSGSKINVVNGPLISVAGAGSLLDVSGALVNFGGSGGNKIVVNNSIAPTATLSGLPVSATYGGSVNIGANPIKNPSLGSISVNGSLISATNNGKINIKAP